MATIVHFEIPADDVGRAKKFYGELFGWQFQDLPPEMNYTLVNTTGEKPVNGGMMKRQHPGQQITNYIDVSSAGDYSAKVESLGGKVLVPKSPIPEIGYFAICMDTEGNVFGLFEADKSVK